MFLTLIFSVMMIGEVRLSMGLPNHAAARMEEAAEEKKGEEGEGGDCPN